jgi:hypothetical protein
VELRSSLADLLNSRNETFFRALVASAELSRYKLTWLLFW